MVVVVEFLEALAENRASVRAAVLMLSRVMLDKKLGCHAFEVGQDDIDGSSFLLYQVYDSKPAYTTHLELPDYAEHRLLIDPWLKSRRTLTYDVITGAGVA
jgi:(4S)-4-hydroxy-5-phosphonooxypentane-2,3-dione isomerase